MRPCSLFFVSDDETDQPEKYQASKNEPAKVGVTLWNRADVGHIWIPGVT